MISSIARLRSYRVALLPAGADRKEVAALAARGAHPSIRVKARDLFHAKLAARHVTGREVHYASQVVE